ncbi:MAG: hypothetical protein LBG96_06730 [Tannerella sp.]|jgi:hypothetical protein|nr:hypothetical protein [Tannerella sp.]
MTNLELEFKDKIISAPLLDNRVISITITQKRDNIEINFGGMDFAPPEMPVSRTWFNGQLKLGDDLLVSVKSYADIHVSSQVDEHVFTPYTETDEEKIRIYHSLKKKLENAGML